MNHTFDSLSSLLRRVDPFFPKDVSDMILLYSNPRCLTVGMFKKIFASMPDETLIIATALGDYSFVRMDTIQFNTSGLIKTYDDVFIDECIEEDHYVYGARKTDPDYETVPMIVINAG